MDEIQRRFSAMQWLYAEQDPAALEELERRIASAGRAGRTMRLYSDLVQGVCFDLPSLKESPALHRRSCVGGLGPLHRR